MRTLQAGRYTIDAVPVDVGMLHTELELTRKEFQSTEILSGDMDGRYHAFEAASQALYRLSTNGKGDELICFAIILEFSGTALLELQGT